MLQPHARPDDRLVYSLDLHELTAGGHGFIDGLARTAAEAAGDIVTMGETDTDPADFADIGPSPLQWAVFSRPHALELVEGTGWEVVSINDPTPGHPDLHRGPAGLIGPEPGDLVVRPPKARAHFP